MAKAVINRAKLLTREVTEIPAGVFKAHCLKLMDQVQREHREIVVTKRGKPVAKLVPYDEAAADIFGYLQGAVSRYGDLVSPLDEVWEADA
ncbi:MAG: type II toxin-antitoxin system Phd/YefM family antitoxin [Truepera sp.]|nr:type II toxin-antitoxin system Phd/YefM family antitoxin [Truepera sp.]